MAKDYFNPPIAEEEMKQGLDLTVDHEYGYPMGLDLHPDRDQHSVLLQRLQRMITASHSVMQNRYGDWQEIDRTITSYIPTQTDEKGEASKKVKKEMIIPVMYAVYETMLAQLLASFADLPLFKYSHVGPEDYRGTLLLEKWIENQSIYFKHQLAIHTMLSDTLRYGVGIVYPHWTVVKGRKIKAVDDSFLGLSGVFGAGKKKKKLEWGTVYAGNKLENIDPYNYIPDPNVPIHNIQAAEYAGWRVRTNKTSLMDEERHNTDLFNVNYIGGNGLTSAYYYNERDEKSGLSSDKADTMTSRPVDRTFLFVKLIPSDWGIGKKEYSELWLFEIAGDDLIISAHPMNLPYSEIPIAICATDFDGHSVSPVSRLEVNYGIQTVIDFLFSSRFENVKRTLNGMFVVNPWLINMKDMTKPGPGKLIRLRRQQFESNALDQGVKQLETIDVTQGHIGDAQQMIELMYRSTGVNENMQGFMRYRGERKSATEARGAQLGSVTRVDRMVRVAAVMAFQDLARYCALNTQYFGDEKTYVKITGRLEKDLAREFGPDGVNGRVEVNPIDIVVDFDVVPHDGSVIGVDQAQVTLQLLQIISQSPEIAQQFDIPRLVMFAARNMGFPNVQDFVKDPAQMQQEVSDAFERDMALAQAGRSQGGMQQQGGAMQQPQANDAAQAEEIMRAVTMMQGGTLGA